MRVPVCPVSVTMKLTSSSAAGAALLLLLCCCQIASIVGHKVSLLYNPDIVHAIRYVMFAMGTEHGIRVGHWTGYIIHDGMM